MNESGTTGSWKSQPYQGEGTMTDLIKMPYGDDGIVLIEIEGSTSDIEELGRKRPGAIERVDRSLESVSTTIVETSQVMVGAFQLIAASPDSGKSKHPLIPKKASLEFGVRFTAEGDIYVVKASGEATVKVTVEWQFRD